MGIVTTHQRRRCGAAVAAAVVAVATAGRGDSPSHGAGSKPHLILELQDDLGAFDNAFNGNGARESTTGNVSRLAREGIILKAHYVFYWCSPTRRSFLTGRLPIHHGQMLSGITDDIDLRWSIISQKLQPAGYKSYWYGKGHTGYQSVNHLPTRRGFLNFTGFLGGMQPYNSSDRWQNEGPLNSTEYSTAIYGNAVLTTVDAHNPADPLFLYLPWQAVHSPYTAPPQWPATEDAYVGMLWDTDCYSGRLRALLEAKGMYANTLWVYSADNGGRGSGINYPLRGEKRTNYEGGMRVSAFVSGGLIPPALRGTTNGVRFHIVDWYATFCYLAGVSSRDDPPTPPLPVDPTNPDQDIYGNSSWPAVDGVVIWDMLMNPADYNLSSAHPTLVLSSEVILKGELKLLTAQRGDTHQNAESYENRWQHPNGTWFAPSGWEQTCGFPVYGGKGSVATFTPCLFNLTADLNETIDLGPTQPDTLRMLWMELNHTWLTYYHARSPASLVGPCNESCADTHWRSLGGTGVGPVCGVEGCAAAPQPPPSPSPPPVPPRHFRPINATNCTYIPHAHYYHRTPDHQKSAGGYVTSQEQCCRLCFEDEYCVAGALHIPAPGKTGPCYLHYSTADATFEQNGTVGCVTGR